MSGASDLKANMANASGADLSGARQNQEQAKQNEMMANAYAQGTDIHLAPGSEKHMAHEATHVVQQQQGQVKPNMASR